MNAKHTLEPWRVEDSYQHGYCVWSGGMRVAALGHGDTVDKNNARRIVACVNSCVGVPTETLERPDFSVSRILVSQKMSEGYPGIAHDLEQMRLQRDETLASLSECLLFLQNMDEGASGAAVRASAIIAKVKGAA